MINDFGYYVTMQRGRRTAYLAGPFDDYLSAHHAKRSARTLAMKLDHWAEFDSFGVTRLEPAARLGVFNHLVRNDRDVRLVLI